MPAPAAVDIDEIGGRSTRPVHRQPLQRLPGPNLVYLRDAGTLRKCPQRGRIQLIAAHRRPGFIKIPVAQLHQTVQPVGTSRAPEKRTECTVRRGDTGQQSEEIHECLLGLRSSDIRAGEIETVPVMERKILGPCGSPKGVGNIRQPEPDPVGQLRFTPRTKRRAGDRRTAGDG